MQMSESEEFLPLIQRHVAASAAELRAEAAAAHSSLKLELKNDIQEISRRSMRDECDELSPLIQRQIIASATELRAESAAAHTSMQLELKSDMQEMNQRSMRLEEQLRELKQLLQ
jgi:hypothetical protein